MQGSPSPGAIGANAPRFLNLHLEYVSLDARIAPRLPTLGIKKSSLCYHFGDKVAQLVRCRTSNQRVAGSIPGHSGRFGRSWEKQFIPYCFSLPSCKMGT